MEPKFHNRPGQKKIGMGTLLDTVDSISPTELPPRPGEGVPSLYKPRNDPFHMSDARRFNGQPPHRKPIHTPPTLPPFSQDPPYFRPQHEFQRVTPLLPLPGRDDHKNRPDFPPLSPTYASEKAKSPTEGYYKYNMHKPFPQYRNGNNRPRGFPQPSMLEPILREPSPDEGRAMFKSRSVIPDALPLSHKRKRAETQAEEVRKERHNQAEKKRRSDMNDAIEKLRSLLPPRAERRLTKVEVLTEAGNHLEQVKNLVGQLIRENRALLSQLGNGHDPDPNHPTLPSDSLHNGSASDNDSDDSELRRSVVRGRDNMIVEYDDEPAVERAGVGVGNSHGGGAKDSERGNSYYDFGADNDIGKEGKHGNEGDGGSGRVRVVGGDGDDVGGGANSGTIQNIINDNDSTDDLDGHSDKNTISDKSKTKPKTNHNDNINTTNKNKTNKKNDGTNNTSEENDNNTNNNNSKNNNTNTNTNTNTNSTNNNSEKNKEKEKEDSRDPTDSDKKRETNSNNNSKREENSGKTNRGKGKGLEGGFDPKKSITAGEETTYFLSTLGQLATAAPPSPSSSPPPPFHKSLNDNNNNNSDSPSPNSGSAAPPGASAASAASGAGSSFL